MDTGKCRSCGAAVFWVVTAAGNKMPIEPAHDGNIIIHDGHAVILARDAYTFSSRYRSHFASCPNAKSHRKSKKGGS